MFRSQYSLPDRKCQSEDSLFLIAFKLGFWWWSGVGNGYQQRLDKEKSAKYSLYWWVVTVLMVGTNVGA
jgi:hypothetical protein